MSASDAWHLSRAVPRKTLRDSDQAGAERKITIVYFIANEFSVTCFIKFTLQLILQPFLRFMCIKRCPFLPFFVVLFLCIVCLRYINMNQIHLAQLPVLLCSYDTCAVTRTSEDYFVQVLSLAALCG